MQVIIGVLRTAYIISMTKGKHLQALEATISIFEHTTISIFEHTAIFGFCITQIQNTVIRHVKEAVYTTVSKYTDIQRLFSASLDAEYPTGFSCKMNAFRASREKL